MEKWKKGFFENAGEKITKEENVKASKPKQSPSSSKKESNIGKMFDKINKNIETQQFIDDILKDKEKE